MKNIKILISGAAFLLLICSTCKKDKFSNFSDIIDISSGAKLTNELGIYTGHFKSHNGNVNIRTDLKDFLSGVNYEGRITAWYVDDLEVIEAGNCGDFYVNEDIQLSNDGQGYSTGEFQGYDFIPNYIKNEVVGKHIRIKHIDTNNEIAYDEEFYVPNYIHIPEAAANRIEGSNFVSMQKNNCTITLSPDEKNNNGILIKFYYRGQLHGMSMDDIQNMEPSGEIARAIHLKEEPIDGRITIPEDFFEDIPSKAIITLYIGRGNGKNINYKGKTHFIRALTQQQLFVVLE